MYNVLWIIKSEQVLNKYLLSNFSIRVTLFKLCTGNHKLQIVKGRFENINGEERLCLLCNKTEIEDVYHYLFACPLFNNERKTPLIIFSSHVQIYKDVWTI